MRSSWERIHDRSEKVMLSLPPWPEGERAAPNAILRSALFGALRNGPRQHLEKIHITTLNSYEIGYTGPELDQKDLDVWMAVLHAVREKELGEVCLVTTYRLLKILGQADTGKTRADLAIRVYRLRSAVVIIKTESYEYSGSLIDKAGQHKKSRRWQIRMDPALRPTLFSHAQFTRLDWQIRRSLARHQLAQWLYTFYQTHERPYPYTEDKLISLSGGKNTNIYSARQRLRIALAHVSKVCGEHNAKFEYRRSNGKVFTWV